MGTSLPFPLTENASLSKTLHGLGTSLPLTMITPHCISSRGHAQTVVLRGIAEDAGSVVLRQYLEDVCPAQLR